MNEEISNTLNIPSIIKYKDLINTPDGVLNIKTLKIIEHKPIAFDDHAGCCTSARYLFQDYKEPLEYIDILKELKFSPSQDEEGSRNLLRQRRNIKDLLQAYYTNLFCSQILGDRKPASFLPIITNSDFIKLDQEIKVKILGSYAAKIPKTELLKLKKKKYTHKNNIISSRYKRLLLSETIDRDDKLDDTTINDLYHNQVYDHKSDTVYDFDSNIIAISECENRAYGRVEYPYQSNHNLRDLSSNYIPGLRLFTDNIIPENLIKLFNSQEYQDRIFTFYINKIHKKNVDDFVFFGSNINLNPVQDFIDNYIVLPTDEYYFNYDSSEDFIETKVIYTKKFNKHLDKLNYKRKITFEEFSQDFSDLLYEYIVSGTIQYAKAYKSHGAGYYGIRWRSLIEY